MKPTDQSNPNEIIILKLGNNPVKMDSVQHFEINVTVVTYKCYRVVAPGSYDTKPLHHSVLHQSLSVRLQSLDGDVLGSEKTVI